jgi:hypothetical protein
MRSRSDRVSRQIKSLGSGLIFVARKGIGRKVDGSAAVLDLSQEVLSLICNRSFLST